MVENVSSGHKKHGKVDAHGKHLEHAVHLEHAAHLEHTAHLGHEDTARRGLEKKLRNFKILSIVLALMTIVLTAYTIYPILSKTASGPELGQSLVGVNEKLSSAELAAINTAPNSNFETAGQALLNLSIVGERIINGSYVGVVYMYKQQQISPFIVNGKPSAIYVGAVSCIYCAENKWAMALALSRFGSFDSLYKGYSSLKDGDVPTLFWAPVNIASNGSVEFANYYRSDYINFISAEYESDITGAMRLPSGGYTFYAQSAQNSSDRLAMNFMQNISQFQGTPVTFFGSTLNRGADAVVFGEWNSTMNNTSYPPLTYMTHKGILDQMREFKTTFAIEEYAAADVYVAEICLAINNSASVCSLPSIRAIEGIIA